MFGCAKVLAINLSCLPHVKCFCWVVCEVYARLNDLLLGFLIEITSSCMAFTDQYYNFIYVAISIKSLLSNTKSYVSRGTKTAGIESNYINSEVLSRKLNSRERICHSNEQPRFFCLAIVQTNDNHE